MSGRSDSAGELAREVMVEIVAASLNEQRPGWDIEYAVTNLMQEPVWLVVDETLKPKQTGSHIELSYARGSMQPEAHVFGYFDPQVVRIDPAMRVKRAVEISWPALLSDLWNAERDFAPEPGMYSVSVRIGFGTSPGPGPFEAGDDVQDPALRWQQEVVSDPISLEIPPYDAHSRES